MRDDACGARTALSKHPPAPLPARPQAKDTRQEEDLEALQARDYSKVRAYAGCGRTQGRRADVDAAPLPGGRAAPSAHHHQPVTPPASHPPALPQVKDASLLRFLVDMRGADLEARQMRDDLMTMLIAGGRGWETRLGLAAGQPDACRGRPCDMLAVNLSGGCSQNWLGTGAPSDACGHLRWPDSSTGNALARRPRDHRGGVHLGALLPHAGEPAAGAASRRPCAHCAAEQAQQGTAPGRAARAVRCVCRTLTRALSPLSPLSPPMSPNNRTPRPRPRCWRRSTRWWATARPVSAAATARRAVLRTCPALALPRGVLAWPACAVPSPRARHPPARPPARLRPQPARTLAACPTCA